MTNIFKSRKGIDEHSRVKRLLIPTKSIVATNPINAIVENAAISAFPTFSCYAY